jgi:predicted hydrocarbon binding protein
MSRISMLEAVKIQARVLIPVVKALEVELGREEAHALVGRAIGESWSDFVTSRNPKRNQHPGEAASGFDFPVESEIVEHTDDSFGRNFTACAFADYFREIGEPEIGALLTCGVDFAVERKLRPEWEFRRTQTQMQGAPFCDFRWRRKPGSSAVRGDRK